MVTAFKPAEHGPGKIIRLVDTSGKGCTAVITSDWRIGETHLIDPLESGVQKKLNLMPDGRLEVELGAHEVKTVLLSLEA